jgi:hypothetical protein
LLNERGAFLVALLCAIGAIDAFIKSRATRREFRWACESLTQESSGIGSVRNRRVAIKPRRPRAKPGISKTARETSEIVVLLREKMGIVEELEPDNRMLREYRHMCGWAISELRRIRALAELDLERHGISRRGAENRREAAASGRAR